MKRRSVDDEGAQRSELLANLQQLIRSSDINMVSCVPAPRDYSRVHTLPGRPVAGPDCGYMGVVEYADSAVNSGRLQLHVTPYMDAK